MESTSEGEQIMWLYNMLNAFVQPLSLEIIIGILIIIILLLFSAMVSGAEVAFFSLSNNDLDEFRQKNDRYSEMVINLLDQPRYLLATILISNNFLNVAIIILSSFIIFAIFDIEAYPVAGFIIEVIVVTFYIVLFGEVIPKVYATQKNKRLAHLMAYPLYFLKRAFRPASYLLVTSTQVIEKKIDRLREEEVSMQEIDHAIELSMGTKASEEEVNILKGIVKFGNITVKQIMRSRVDIVAVDINTPYTKLLDIVKDSGYSRIPVFKETIDELAGVLYAKDLLKHLNEKDDFSWQKLLREPFFVPSTKNISDLLHEMQTNHIHLAVVVDEYGGTLGLVTLEDIMEEIIGEIKDEFDEQEEHPYVKLDENNYIFDGKMLLNDAARIMGLPPESFDPIKGESDTLAGLILELSGKMPEKDEELKSNGFRFKVLSVGKKRVEKVKTTCLSDDNKS